jgi:hypothetical protein
VKLIRLMLITSVLLTAYVAVLLAIYLPFLWIAYIVIAIACLCKKGHQTLTSHGTARWANQNDLKQKGMIDE